MHIVYRTTNLINGKIYIGMCDVEKPTIDSYLGSGTYLKRAFKKYGRENFTRETLFEFKNREDAYLKEAELVNTEFVQREDTYNLCGGGRGSGSGENHYLYGKHLPDETKKKIGIALSLTNKGENNPNYGKHPSDETRKKMSLAHSGENNPNWGKHFSEEAKKNMSIAQSGKNNPNYGKSRSDKTKKKISIANTGKYRSEEAKKNMTIAHLGEGVFEQRILDIQHIEKIWGWKSKLAKRWGVTFSTVWEFINKHTKDLNYTGNADPCDNDSSNYDREEAI